MEYEGGIERLQGLDHGEPCNHTQKSLDFILQNRERHLGFKLQCATDAQMDASVKRSLGVQWTD